MTIESGNRTNKVKKKDKDMRAFSILICIILALAMMSGCSGSTSGKTNDDYKGQTIYGEVTKVSSDSITIDVGTSNLPGDSNDQNGAPDGQPPEMPGNDSDSSGSDNEQTSSERSKPSFIEKTGESATITVDKDTEITKSGMGGFMGMPGGAPDGQPPERPDGDSSDENGQPPEMPDGGSFGETIELSDISEGDIVAITIDENGKTESIKLVMDSDSMQGGPGGNSDNADSSGAGKSTASVNYTAVKTYEENASVSDETVESTGDDENALLIKDGNVVLDKMNITRKSDSSSGGDNASFYGLSAAVLGTGGKTYLSDSKITTDADGGAGVFAYGDGTVYVSGTKISTSNGASGGIHAAGGGTLYAWDLDVTTSGRSSAAIRSDRGGGTMVVSGGKYTSKGNGSPAIYSTADITVHDADLTAKGSEAICIEGKNSIRLFDCSLSGNMKDDEQNDCTWNVILYQSMSGDSEEGTSVFEMDGGDLTAKNGGMFYTTNTSSKFVLKDVDITYAEDNDFFLKATGNSNARGWGQAGSNGADCDFTAIDQDMEGDVIWDKISKVDFYMTSGSTLKGAVVKDDSNAGDGTGDGSCNVYLDSDSTWTVTGDSEVTNLYNAGTIKGADGKTVTIKSTDGKVYEKGTGKYTITVKTYSTKDKTSGADKITTWKNYKVEKPNQLA